MPTIQVLDPRFASVAAGASALEHLCTGAEWSEGPVWMRETGAVLWSDIPQNRMLSWRTGHCMAVWREDVEFTNGHGTQADGALLHCCHVMRALTRTLFDGASHPL